MKKWGACNGEGIKYPTPTSWFDGWGGVPHYYHLSRCLLTPHCPSLRHPRLLSLRLGPVCDWPRADTLDYYHLNAMGLVEIACIFLPLCYYSGVG